MKKNESNVSGAYRGVGFERIEAPKTSKGSVKATAVKSDKDLRGGRK